MADGGRRAAGDALCVQLATDPARSAFARDIIARMRYSWANDPGLAEVNKRTEEKEKEKEKGERPRARRCDDTRDQKRRGRECERITRIGYSARKEGTITREGGGGGHARGRPGDRARCRTFEKRKWVRRPRYRESARATARPRSHRRPSPVEENACGIHHSWVQRPAIILRPVHPLASPRARALSLFLSLSFSLVLSRSRRADAGGVVPRRDDNGLL